jgi:predicted lipoprotein with Yx(FWY)xxD motif
MRHPRRTLSIVALSVAAIVGGFLVAGSGGSSGATPAHVRSVASAAKSLSAASAPTPHAPDPSVTPTPTVRTAVVTIGGTRETILETGKGLPLYTYQPDSATTSMVTGELAGLWPPLLATAPTLNGATGALSTLTSTNGRQVTYNGHFLYTFVEDSPGHVTGQGVQNFAVATPGISLSRAGATSAGSSASTTSASSRNGY